MNCVLMDSAESSFQKKDPQDFVRPLLTSCTIRTNQTRQGQPEPQPEPSGFEQPLNKSDKFDRK